VPVIHHGCEAHYADSLFLSLFLSSSRMCCIRLPYGLQDVRTGRRSERMVFKNALPNLVQILHFPFFVLADPAPSLRRIVSQPIRPIDSRPIVQTIQLFRNQRSTILWARIFVPEDQVRRSFDCVFVRSPVSVVNYFSFFFELLRLCYRYQVICNYVT